MPRWPPLQAAGGACYMEGSQRQDVNADRPMGDEERVCDPEPSGPELRDPVSSERIEDADACSDHADLQDRDQSDVSEQTRGHRTEFGEAAGNTGKGCGEQVEPVQQNDKDR